MESNIVVDISPLYNFDGGGQATPKFAKSQVCNVFTISQKRS